MKFYKVLSYCVLSVGLTISACTDLDVVNPNNPSANSITEETLSDLAAGALYNVFNGYSPFPETGNNFNVNVHLAWAADHVSMTNNYRSMWSQFQTEPRVQFNNSLTFADLEIVSDPWQNWNAAIVAANTVIDRLGEDVADEDKGTLAAAYLAKGLALGHIAGVFDRGYVVPEGTDVATVDPVDVLVPYQQVLDAAIAALDEAIAISETASYTLGTRYLAGINYNQDQVARLANTWAAHFLVTTPRNREQAAQVDWAQVKAYTEQGMTEDFVITNDGQFFLHDLQFLSGLFWYFRVDHRVLRHFNENYPKRFPTDANANIPEAELAGPGYNGDERLQEYFSYSSDLSFFSLERGPQLRTHYYLTRYNDLWDNIGVGPAVYMYAYANELMRAEASLRLGNKAEAISILNDPANPRKAVGMLPDIPMDASEDEVLELIFAERDIELARTAFGLEHYDMRRKDALQIGTPLHMPVPADELTTIGEPIYSYGGPGNADGVNTADGSNSWLND